MMKKIDEFLYKQCDDAKNNPNYQRFLDFLNNQSDENKKSLKILSTIALLSLPLIICLVMVLNISEMKSLIEQKENIIAFSHKVILENQKMTDLQSAMLNDESIENGEQLRDKIIQMANMPNVTSKVSVNNFEQNTIGDSLKENKVVFNFKDLNLSQLSLFIEASVNNLKIKISNSRVTLNEANNSLSGTLTMHYFSR